MESSDFTHFEHRAILDTEQVTVRLMQRDTAFFIERVTALREQPFLRACVPLLDLFTLERFFSSDPLANSDLKRAYELILNKYTKLSTKGRELAFALDQHPKNAKDTAVAIKQCRHEGEVHARLRAFLDELGANQYLFLTLQKEKGLPVQYDYLCGYDPAWIQLYLHHRRWFLSDRSIALAQADVGTICGSRLSGVNPVDEEMSRLASVYGIASWTAVAVHQGSKDSVGILYVASSVSPDDGGEEALERERPWFKLLASELLDWRLDRRDQIIASRYNLVGNEMPVFKLAKDGHGTKEIASLLGLSTHTIYHLNASVCEKISASAGIREAARRAFRDGFIS